MCYSQIQVSSMIEIRQHEDLNLAEENGRNWKEITDETYSFERLNNEVQYVHCVYIQQNVS